MIGAVSKPALYEHPGCRDDKDHRPDPTSRRAYVAERRHDHADQARGQGNFDAPEAPGLAVALRGLSMVCDNEQVLEVTGAMFDGLYAFFRRELVLGTEPS